VSSKVMGIRRREQQMLFRISFIQSVLSVLIFVVPTLAAVVTFIVHIEAGHDLKASQAYSVIALLNILFLPLSVTPQLMRQFSEVRIGLVRLGQLMRRESFVQDFPAPDDDNVVIAIDGANFAWPVGSNLGMTPPPPATTAAHGSDKNDGTTTQVGATAAGTSAPRGSADSVVSSTNTDVVRGLRLAVMKGELLGVCGRVGSGKSAVITAMLGQMRCTTEVSGRDGIG
jgi:ATP-binding cassette subfamily C (CFTR/MRP) protein 5